MNYVIEWSYSYFTISLHIHKTAPFRYSSEEIHFNLMAIVSDRKQSYLREIEALNHQKRQLLEQVTAWCTNFYSAVDLA